MTNSSSRVGKDNRGKTTEGSEETLEVGGALRLRLEAEG
jgi:hypothetical protein